ncbi:hypothetical protein D3C86_1814350 [compost metagenome]
MQRPASASETPLSAGDQLKRRLVKSTQLLCWHCWAKPTKRRDVAIPMIWGYLRSSGTKESGFALPQVKARRFSMRCDSGSATRP